MSTLTQVEVFNRWAYTTINEMVAQNIDLFNQQTRGAIILQNANNTGDYSDSTFWGFLAGAVRRRNAYGSGAVAPINLQMLLDTMVKVAGGTPPINIDPVMFTWINKSPEEGAAVIAAQLAPQILQDMLNTAITALAAALTNVAGVYQDVSAGAGVLGQFSAANTNVALTKFGDRRQQVVAWVVHSKAIGDYFANNIANAAQLFTYESVNVIGDPFGNVFIVTDSPALVVSGDYLAMGLVAGAAVIQRNDDFTQNMDTTNGDENIKRTYQAEWTYNLGIKGFTWDKTSGGKSPTQSALGTAANWDRNATSDKDLAGVVLRTS